MITQENEYYIRYVLLLFKGGAALLRAKTENALRTARLTFNQFLQLSKVKLETKKHLSKTQQELLYPKSGRDASLADLDITVLSHLICIDCIGQDADDLKIARALREMRNEVAHPGEPQIDFVTYNGKWTTLVTLLSAGSSALTKQEQTDIKAIIDSAAIDPLNIAEVLTQLKLLDDTQICFENIKKSLQVIEHNIEKLVKTQVETLDEVTTVKEMVCTFETSQREHSTKVKQGIDNVTKTQTETHEEVQAVKSRIENVQVSQQQTCGNIMELSKSVLTIQQTQDRTLDEVDKVSQRVQTQQVSIEEIKKELVVLRDNNGNNSDVHIVKGKLEVDPESLKAVMFEALKKILLDRQETPNRTNVEDAVGEVLETIEGPGIKVESVSEGSVVLTFRCLSFDAVLSVIDCFESSTFKDRITDVARAIEEVTGQFVRIRAFIDISSLQRIIAYYKKKPKRTALMLQIACAGIDGLIQAMEIFEGEETAESVNKLSKVLSEAVGEPVQVRTSIDRNQMMKTVQAIKRHTEKETSDSVYTEDSFKKAELSVHSDSSSSKLQHDWEARKEAELMPEAISVAKTESKPIREFKPESELKTQTELMPQSKPIAKAGCRTALKSRGKTESVNKTETIANTNLEPETVAGTDLKQEFTTEPEVKFKHESGLMPKTEIMPKSRKMSKAELKSAQKFQSESETETETEMSPETKNLAEIEFKLQSKSTADIELKPESELKPETESDTKLKVVSADLISNVKPESDGSGLDNRQNQYTTHPCVEKKLQYQQGHQKTEAEESIDITQAFEREYVETRKHRTLSSSFECKKRWNLFQYSAITVSNSSYNTDSWLANGAVLSRNRVLLADYGREKIVVVDLHTHSVVQTIELDGKPFDFALLRNDKAVLTMPGNKSLILLNIKRKVSVLKRISLDRECWGITSSLKTRNVYAICWKPISILTFDTECEICTYMPIVENDRRLNLRPLYIALSNDEKHLYINGAWLRDSILKMNLQGQIVGNIAEETIEGPKKLFALDEDNLICYAEFSGAIHIISTDLQQGRILRQAEAGADCIFTDSCKQQIFVCHKDRITIFKRAQ